MRRFFGFTEGQASAGISAVVGLTTGLASLSCCVLPLVLFSLGTGGAWLGRLGALSVYQPYFIGVAVLSVTLGAWQWRRAQIACRIDGCAMPLSQYLLSGALVLAMLSIVIALLFPFYVQLFFEGGQL